MPTATGHTSAILASRVQGTDVYNDAGEKIGHVEDVVFDKMSNRIMYAVLGFGGFLGLGEKYHPVPWAVLDYNESHGGYVIHASKAELEAAPHYTLDELVGRDGNWSDA